MIRRLSIGLAVGLALLAAGAAFAGGSARLTVPSRSPFTVHGTSFHRGEHVLVAVTTTPGGRATRRVQAGAAGGFTVRFPSVQLLSCQGYIVQATGSTGSHAVIRVRPPECAAPVTP
jgi:hypothetical protein